MSTSLRVAAVAVLSTAALPFLSANPASAVVVTVGGSAYDVTTMTTSYDTSTSLFQLPAAGTMPWWGDDALASEFAAQVYNALGSGWDPDYGPVFAYGQSVGQVLGLAQSISNPLDQIDVTPATNTSALFGVAAALGWSRQLKKRIEMR
jgi:hypothetical protein